VLAGSLVRSSVDAWMEAESQDKEFTTIMPSQLGALTNT
jgi:hypothetical protein